MSLDRVIKQIGKEARRSPKKAAVLGVLTLVAAWFWGPLLWGWIAPQQSPDEADTGQAAVVGSASPPPVPRPAASGAGSVGEGVGRDATHSPAGVQPASAADWRELVEWMEIDRLTQPAELTPGQRDPFVHPVEPEPAAVVEEEAGPESEETPVAADPESLGLVLSSTIIGPKRSAARINGKTYGPGQIVVVSKDGRQYEFVLAEIHPRQVVLVRESERFELNLPKPQLSDAIRPFRALGGNLGGN